MYGQKRPERSIWFQKKNEVIRKYLHITMIRPHAVSPNYNPAETLKEKRARLIKEAAQARDWREWQQRREDEQFQPVLHADGV